MATQTPPRDTPYGLEPNVAAGLAYLFGLLGGIVILAGGGTNKFVRWAAAQSIVLWAAYVIVWFVLKLIFVPLWSMNLFLFWLLLSWIVGLVWLAAWLWTFISGFQGRDVRVPVIASLTESIFKSSL
ncbi:MAG: DUF4870 domain-containing protein [Candidatus Tyrphobacter sp.]